VQGGGSWGRGLERGGGRNLRLNAERVKYETYVEALSSAIKLRALHNGKKEVERMLANAS
jgi:hypothetical protein